MTTLVCLLGPQDASLPKGCAGRLLGNGALDTGCSLLDDLRFVWERRLGAVVQGVHMDKGRPCPARDGRDDNRSVGDSRQCQLDLDCRSLMCWCTVGGERCGQAGENPGQPRVR